MFQKHLVYMYYSLFQISKPSVWLQRSRNRIWSQEGEVKNRYSNQENLSIVGCDGFQNKSIVTCELKYEEDIIYLNFEKGKAKERPVFCNSLVAGFVIAKEDDPKYTYRDSKSGGNFGIRTFMLYWRANHTGLRSLRILLMYQVSPQISQIATFFFIFITHLGSWCILWVWICQKQQCDEVEHFHLTGERSSSTADSSQRCLICYRSGGDCWRKGKVCFEKLPITVFSFSGSNQ